MSDDVDADAEKARTRELIRRAEMVRSGEAELISADEVAARIQRLLRDLRTRSKPR